YGGYDFAATADYWLLEAAVDTARERGIDVKVGNIHSADLFYNPDAEAFDRMEKMGVLAVEMEAAGLYGVAAEHGGRALTIVTVSDHIRTGEQTTSEERERTFTDMVEVALGAILKDTAR
ncbi:MAG: purine-nucleoside phosphorylase, partial [Actinomycetes bacterium]